jgi:hypothetical protein
MFCSEKERNTAPASGFLRLDEAMTLKASLRIGPQASWELIGYSSEYNLEKTCEDVSLWYRREPWIAKPT